jgi:hypothetical protein
VYDDSPHPLLQFVLPWDPWKRGFWPSFASISPYGTWRVWGTKEMSTPRAYASSILHCKFKGHRNCPPISPKLVSSTSMSLVTGCFLSRVSHHTVMFTPKPEKWSVSYVDGAWTCRLGSPHVSTRESLCKCEACVGVERKDRWSEVKGLVLFLPHSRPAILGNWVFCIWNSPSVVLQVLLHLTRIPRAVFPGTF